VLPSSIEIIERGEYMSKKHRGLLTIAMLVMGTVLISACTRTLSQTPLTTPTLIPTGLFVSPFPTTDNPMAMIQEFAKQTAAAQTAIAGGGVTGTPGTLQVSITGTMITAQAGGSITPTATAGTPTNANAVSTTPAVIVTPGGPTSTPVPVGYRPTSYTLQAGEFPYCIARRFNVDPDALLSLSGLTSPDLYYPGLILKIPQSGAFPGDRALASHPATYTVSSSDETIYGIACKYGDVDPAAIASANGISASASLSVGQQIKIP
jgi:LysM repeat protein